MSLPLPLSLLLSLSCFLSQLDEGDEGDGRGTAEGDWTRGCERSCEPLAKRGDRKQVVAEAEEDDVDEVDEAFAAADEKRSPRGRARARAHLLGLVRSRAAAADAKMSRPSTRRILILNCSYYGNEIER